MDGVAVASLPLLRGYSGHVPLENREDFCRADTGDDFDDRFDAVIPIEQVEFPPEGGLRLHDISSVQPGDRVRPCGSTIRKGQLLVPKHRQLRPFDLASLAMGGMDQVKVFAKPKVAFLPTGSELVPLGAAVERGCNIDSNSILAHNLLREMGAEPLCYPIVPDRPEDVAAALDRALEEADVVLLNGGSSKGAEDFNARLLEERGAALFHWVAAAPGKPMCVALIGQKPVINLPGPPLAVLYGMDWCIRAIVHRLLHTPLHAARPSRPSSPSPSRPPAISRMRLYDGALAHALRIPDQAETMAGRQRGRRAGGGRRLYHRAGPWLLPARRDAGGHASARPGRFLRELFSC